MGDMFSAALQDKINHHISTKCTDLLSSGQYNRVIDSYISALHLAIKTKVYKKQFDEENEDQKAMRILKERIKGLDKGDIKDVLPPAKSSKPESSKPEPAKAESDKKPFRPFKKYDSGKPGDKKPFPRKQTAAACNAEEAETEEQDNNSNESEDTDTGGIQTRLDELAAHMIAMANATNAVLQLPSLYQAPVYQCNLPHTVSVTSPSSSAQAQQNLALEVHPNKPQITDPEEAKRIIDRVKEEPCIFSHKTKNVKHTIWGCALYALQKAEELAGMNRCRICWQTGHKCADCTVKVTILCDHCKLIGHWQPFCGVFISESIARLKAKYAEELVQDAKTTSRESTESYEQFEKRVAARAAREGLLATSNALMASHYASKVGASMPNIGKIPCPVSNAH
jgi:hypothetical protein